MLIRFAILASGGIEIYHYEPKKTQHLSIDPQLVAGFMTALQMFSESMGSSIQQIQFSNLMLYMRSYGDFTFQLLLDEMILESELEQYFDQLAKETIPILSNRHVGEPINKKIFEEKLLAILFPLIQDPLSETQFQELPRKTSVSRIAIVGLGNAGKTSIKNKFFDNWSKILLKNVRPTIGLEISSKFQTFLKETLVILDFGGQVIYREQHLKRPEVWENLSALIFVVDIQDVDSFKASKDYLSKVWHLVSQVNEKKPKLSIFLHKYDINLREDLTRNTKEFLVQFEEHLGIASFHSTTIEDSSSNIAMIKSLYFSLPDVMLRIILEEEFLNHFEMELLPRFTRLAHDERFKEIFQESKAAIRQSAVIFGMSYGLSLEEAWMKYLIGEWIPRQRFLTLKSVKVTQIGQNLYLAFPKWKEEILPKSLAINLFDGMLEGLLKTFHLEPPKMVEETEGFIVWEVAL